MTPGREARAILLLALAPAIGLGIARFAYALILPDMRSSLDWSYAQAGLMNTLNAAGYLAGALLAARVIARSGAERTVRWGAVACVLSLAASAATASFAALALFRLVAGIGAAVAFIAGATLAAGLSQRRPERSAFLLSLFYVGPGIGIVLSGLLTPALIERLGPGSWWIAWAALAVLSGVLALGLWLGVPTAPLPGRQGPQAPTRVMAMLPFLSGYALFGVGYIAYMTFMIALIREQGGGTGLQSLFWSVVGLAAIGSPAVSSKVIAALKGGRAAAVLMLVTFVGAVLPLLHGGVAVLLLSAALFGSAFFAVVAATTAFVRQNLPQPAWAAGIGVMTVAFGIGQTVGPYLAGAIIDAMGGSLTIGLGASAGVLALGAAVTFVQAEIGRIASEA